MELILISNSKLKIMLTSADLSRYDLDCETIDYDNTETRRAFWSILDEVKQLTGFDAAADRVFVQVYPSREGGCEMYITKLLEETAEAQRRADRLRLPQKNGKSAGTARTDSRPERKPVNRTDGMLVYRFANLSALIELCRRLGQMSIHPDSAAYSEAGGECYLVMPADKMPGEYGRALIGEFAETIESGTSCAYISEYCDCICPGDAIEKLAMFLC